MLPVAVFFLARYFCCYCHLISGGGFSGNQSDKVNVKEIREVEEVAK